MHGCYASAPSSDAISAITLALNLTLPHTFPPQVPNKCSVVPKTAHPF
uniref:Uncharacterized protein n=1 Tax=Anguilla anguilla TaxID=7936 RepID=A0A0E9PJ79_ANGAN